MTEQEFAELTEGETVRVGDDNGVVKYFTEQGAGVEFGGGEVLNVEYPKMARA